MKYIYKITGYLMNPSGGYIFRRVAAYASSLQKAEEIIADSKKVCDYFRVEEYRVDKPSQFEVFPSSHRVYDNNGELLSISKGSETVMKKRFYEGEYVAVAQNDNKVITGILLKKGKTFEILTLDGYAYVSMSNVFKGEYSAYTEYEKLELQGRLKKAIKNRENNKLLAECQEKIKSFCHCYHSEEECPEEYLDTEKEYIWAAEMLFIKNNVKVVKKVSQEWFDTQIIEYLREWGNTSIQWTIGEHFFDLFPAPDYQDKVLKKFQNH